MNKKKMDQNDLESDDNHNIEKEKMDNSPVTITTAKKKQYSFEFMVNSALKALDQKGGVSIVVIKKFLIDSFTEFNQDRMGFYINKYLNKAVKDGTIKQIKRKYKLLPKEKKTKIKKVPTLAENKKLTEKQSKEKKPKKKEKTKEEVKHEEIKNNEEPSTSNDRNKKTTKKNVTTKTKEIGKKEEIKMRKENDVEINKETEVAEKAVKKRKLKGRKSLGLSTVTPLRSAVKLPKNMKMKKK